MSYLKEIDSAKYIFISKIFEPKVNILEFELTLGQISELEENVIIDTENFGSASKIYVDEKSPKYKIRFDSYIGYSVLDESYADKLGDEYKGINIRIYSDSIFLNYIKEDTFASKDYPGEYIHYAFLSENHILNVASENKPKIIKIN